jgi:hypothetical protein
MVNDVWQVQVQGVIYETDTETLKQWAMQGNLLPQDLVKKGSLNWTPAGNVPVLRPIFGTGGLPSSPSNPGFSSSPNVPAYSPPPVVPPPTYQPPPPAPVKYAPPVAPAYGSVQSSAAAHTMVCRNHPQLAPDYVCNACAAPLCQNCVKMVANRMPVCTVCGELCQPYGNLSEQMSRTAYQSSGFGITDLFDAFRFPFSDVVALIAFCVVYTILRVAASFGGLFGGLLLTAVSTGMLFATMSTVIRRVSDGRVSEGYTPEFGSFYDDLIHPMFLSVGVFLISFGPFAIALIYAGTGMIRAFMGGVYEDDGAAAQARAQTAVALLVAGIGAIWGLLYYPMALLVAGFTQSFPAVLNPLVGLDTIRRMGGTYGLVFLMYVVLAVIGGGLGLVIRAVTPGFVSTFLISPLDVYFSLVLCYLLGIALFKCSDRLGLN